MVRETRRHCSSAHISKVSQYPRETLQRKTQVPAVRGKSIRRLQRGAQRWRRGNVQGGYVFTFDDSTSKDSL